MEKKQGEENQKNPADRNGKGHSPTGNDATDAPNDNINASSTHTIHHEPINIILEKKQPQDVNAASANRISALSNRIGKRANRISIGNLILAIAIFIITYLLFRETQKSTKAAIDSATAAQNTYAEQRYNDSITRYNESIQSIADSINTAKRFVLDSLSRDLQNKSLAAQIQSIKETQRQFDVTNRPYIQLSDFDFTTLEVGKPIKIKYRIENVGSQPAKLQKTEVQIRISPIVLAPSNVKNIKKMISAAKLKSQIGFQYINRNGVIDLNFETDDPLPNSIMDGLIAKKMFFYLIGKITYLNVLNDRTRQYTFCVEIVKFKGETEKVIYPIYSENYDINSSIIKKY